jgi:crotonobetainyl-CoA:carnitine CoA-transferase CaiB-like acyl-CoA transferase
VANRQSLIPEIERLCRQKTTRCWLELLAADVPCGPINDIAQAFAEPQARHRRMRFELTHPSGARVPQVRNPALFSRSPLEYRDPPPTRGQHTDEVLSRELGLSLEELAERRRSGVIG